MRRLVEPSPDVAAIETAAELDKRVVVQPWLHCLSVGQATHIGARTLPKPGFANDRLLSDCSVETTTTESIGNRRRFDAILYLDVLEHIADDRAELARAARLLRPSGKIIVLAPAHQWLFTPFDSAIGHHRRYNRPSLQAIAPDGCRLVRLSYLDSVGMLASLMNRVFLRQPMPRESQILLWDGVLVRLSRIVDQVSFHKVGKSILAVWQLVDSGQGRPVG